MVNPVTPIDTGFDPLEKPLILPIEYFPTSDPLETKPDTLVSDFIRQVITPTPPVKSWKAAIL